MIGLVVTTALFALSGSLSQDTGKDLENSLRSYLDSAAESGFSGSVLVVKKGSVFINEGYGLANREKGIPNRPETVFDIGSISKQFTKAAILKLEDEGKLGTEEPLSKFFKEVPEDKADITLQHLMDHTSGLGEYHDTEGDFEPMNREEALRRILAQKLRFAPGEKSAYSNSGYTLLAIIVEEVSGQSFPSFLREKLLNPAGMDRTGFYQDSRWKDEEVAVGYGGRKVGDISSPLHWPTITWALAGNGGMVSSTGELYQWIRALNDRKILSEASLEKFYRGDPPQSRSRTDGPYIAYAGGNDFGFIAVVFELFGEDSVIIAASNAMGRRNAEETGKQLARLMLGKEPVPEKEEATSGKEWGLPASSTGRQASALLNAIYIGTEDAARRFIAENLSPAFVEQFSEEQHLQIFRELQSMLPDVELMEARKTGPFSARLTLRSKKLGHEVEISYELESEPPHRIASMEVEESR